MALWRIVLGAALLVIAAQPATAQNTPAVIIACPSSEIGVGPARVPRPWRAEGGKSAVFYKAFINRSKLVCDYQLPRGNTNFQISQPAPKGYSCEVKGRREFICRQEYQTVRRLGTSLRNTDYPGRDFRRIPMSAGISRNPAQRCAQMCLREQRCVAWTFVRRGVQGPAPVCYLKDSVPPARRSDCCTSGRITVARR